LKTLFSKDYLKSSTEYSSKLKNLNPEVVLDAKAVLGEGPCWIADSKILYWVDIQLGLVHIFDTVNQTDRWFDMRGIVSSIVPRKSGGAIVTLQHGFYAMNLENGQTKLVAEIEREIPGNKMNDGKCDARGRLWAGTMDISEKPGKGSLYCLETNGSIRKLLSGITLSNGLGWSPDNSTMYYIDTTPKKVFAFDFDLDQGTITHQRTIVDFFEKGLPGNPDGMAVDVEGMLWVAHVGAGMIGRWNPETGKLLETVEVPATNVTSCCFGGKNMDELYITSATIELDQATLDREPHSGGLFRARPGVKGLSTFVYEG
jgi:sugar lactone lactonase YvrE